MGYEKFDKAHSKAKENISAMLDRRDASDVAVLGRWLLETEANPYGFLPERWAGSVETATGLVGLLNHLDHAMVDDGDVCFPVVDGCPKIAFLSEYDLTLDNLSEYIGAIPAEFFIADNRPLSDVQFLMNGRDFVAAKEAFDLEREEYYARYDPPRIPK